MLAQQLRDRLVSMITGADDSEGIFNRNQHSDHDADPTVGHVPTPKLWLFGYLLSVHSVLLV